VTAGFDYAAIKQKNGYNDIHAAIVDHRTGMFYRSHR
jgi:hypothetical protein